MSRAGDEPKPCVPPGDPEWVHQFGTSSADLGRDVAVAPDGSVYVVGYTTGTLPGQTGFAGWDGFIAKFDPRGAKLWVHQFGASQDDRALGIDIDSAGNVFIAGTTWGTFPGQQHSGGGTDGFVARFQPDGTQVWLTQFGAGDSDQAYRVAVDDVNGAVYVSGSTLGTFPGERNHGDRDGFVARFSMDGRKEWVRQFGSSGGDSAPALGVDKFGGGDVFVAGYTTGALPGQAFAGGVDTFVIRYTFDGMVRWIRQFGTSGATIATDVAVDEEGNLYIAGHTAGTLPSQVSAGGTDGYLVKYDAKGDLEWIRQFGASQSDPAFGVDVTHNGQIIVVSGHTAGAFPGQLNAGGSDVYLVAFSSDGEPLWSRQTGSSGNDATRAVAVDSLDDERAEAYVVGRTWGEFPGQQSIGSLDAFLLRWSLCGAAAVIGSIYDLSGDGSVNVFDLLILLAQWGPCDDCTACPADFDGDCIVNVFDLLLLLSNWG